MDYPIAHRVIYEQTVTNEANEWGVDNPIAYRVLYEQTVTNEANCMTPPVGGYFAVVFALQTCVEVRTVEEGGGEGGDRAHTRLNVTGYPQARLS